MKPLPWIALTAAVCLSIVSIEARAQAIGIGAGQSFPDTLPAVGGIGSSVSQNVGSIPDGSSITAPGNLGQPGGPPFGEPNPPAPITGRGAHRSHSQRGAQTPEPSESH
jgi:hypothetical protein